MAVSNLSKKWLISAVGVLALVALIAATSASRSGATEAASASETFSVLDPGSAARTSLPDGSEEWLESLADFGGPETVPSELAVADSPSGEAIVVAGSAESLCVLNADLGLSNCADLGLAATGQVYTASPDLSASPDGCAGWNVLGVMPDGVESLTVDAPGGIGPASIPVNSNVYTATLAPVRTTLSSGSISLEIPLDEFAASNTGC